MNMIKTSPKQRLLVYFFASGAVEAILALIVSFLTPTNPQKAWLLGYSRAKWSLAIFLMLSAVFFLALSYKTLRNSLWAQAIIAWVEKLQKVCGWVLPAFILAFDFFVLGPYIFLLLRRTPSGFIYSISPLVFFALTRSIQALIMLWRWPGASRDQTPRARSCDPQININPQKVIIVMSAMVILLILATLSGNFIDQIAFDPKLFRLMTKMYLDQESNIPTFFSALLLFFNACILGIIGWLRSREGAAYHFSWTLLALIFLIMAIDEASQLHELLNQPMELLVEAEGIFLWSWVLAAIPMVLIFGLIFLRFYWHLPRKTKVLFGFAAFFYIGGALGTELLGAGWVSSYGKENMIYIIISTIEETLELTGLLILLYALLDYCKTQYAEMRVIFT